MSDHPTGTSSPGTGDHDPADGHDGHTDGNTEVWCVVVAGGSGRRFGGAKQFALLAGRRVIDRAVATAAAVCDGVVVVVPVEVAGTQDAEVPGATRVVTGGPTRVASAGAGIDAVPASAAVVLVHDAARPLASPAVFRRVLSALRGGARAAVPAVAVADTIRDVDHGVVDRGRLRAVQTPQGFAAEDLRAAHRAAAAHAAGHGDPAEPATDDATLVEAGGVAVSLVEGEVTNLKLTSPADLVMAEALLASGDVDQPAAPPDPVGGAARGGGG